MSKTILLTLTYLVGAGELILAIYFWATNSKNEIRRVMAFLATMAATWVLLSASIAYNITSDWALVANRFIYLTGVFMVTAIVHLALVFPRQVTRIDRFHTILLYIPATLFSSIAVFTDSIVKATRQVGNLPGQPIGGVVYPFYNIYLISLFVGAIFLFVVQRKRADGEHRKNVNILIAAFLVGGLPAVYIDLVSALFKTEPANYLVGNIATAIWLGATTYIVMKK